MQWTEVTRHNTHTHTLIIHFAGEEGVQDREDTS